MNSRKSAGPLVSHRSAAKRRRRRAVSTRFDCGEIERLEQRLVLTVGITGSYLVEPVNGQAVMQFVVTRDGDLTQPVGVAFHTVDGSAEAGTDYVAQTGVAQFAAGSATATIDITILSDAAVETPQTFSVQLTALVDPPPEFQPSVSFSVNSTPTSVAAGDFNGDGKLDMVVGHVNFNAISILLSTTEAGATTPSFAAKQDIPLNSRPHAVTVRDFNGDGKPDVAVATLYSGEVAVLLNQTSPGATSVALSDPQRFAVGSSPFDVKVSDINQDGLPDIVSISNPSQIVVLLNKTAAGATTPSFADAQTFTGPQNPRGIAIADYNGDGKPDIASSGKYGQKTAVLLNTTIAGSNVVTFTNKIDLPVGNLTHSLAAGDLNGDGKPDLAVAGYNDFTISIFLNTTATGATTPSFADPVLLPMTKRPNGVLIADVTGDGRPEVIAANFSDQADFLSAFPNRIEPGTSTVSFGDPSSLGTGRSPNAIITADFNADGIPDLASSNATSNSVTVLLAAPHAVVDASAIGTIIDGTGPVFDIDASGGTPAPFTDGDLVLAYLFGLPDAQLSTFVSAGATRNNSDIRATLDALKAAKLLDIDGSGQIGPFTDGNLILGYLFGLGDNFLQPFIALTATRTLQEIRTELDRLSGKLANPTANVESPKAVLPFVAEVAIPVASRVTTDAAPLVASLLSSASSSTPASDLPVSAESPSSAVGELLVESPKVGKVSVQSDLKWTRLDSVFMSPGVLGTADI